jgi:hypothetical protein
MVSKHLIHNSRVRNTGVKLTAAHTRLISKLEIIKTEVLVLLSLPLSAIIIFNITEHILLCYISINKKNKIRQNTSYSLFHRLGNMFQTEINPSSGPCTITYSTFTIFY